MEPITFHVFYLSSLFKSSVPVYTHKNTNDTALYLYPYNFSSYPIKLHNFEFPLSIWTNNNGEKRYCLRLISLTRRIEEVDYYLDEAGKIKESK